MREYFVIKVKAINNEVLEFPKTLNFFCDKVVPLGVQLIRQFDGNECINVTRVFAFEMGGQRYGTQVVTDIAGWRQYINSNCKCCGDGVEYCHIESDGCELVDDSGCKITIDCSQC